MSNHDPRQTEAPHDNSQAIGNCEMSGEPGACAPQQFILDTFRSIRIAGEAITLQKPDGIFI
ncbi:MAG: hypothetical protein WCI51_03315 [Lentisphaerota bacterium]